MRRARLVAQFVDRLVDAVNLTHAIEHLHLAEQQVSWPAGVACLLLFQPGDQL